MIFKTIVKTLTNLTVADVTVALALGGAALIEYLRL